MRDNYNELYMEVKKYIAKPYLTLIDKAYKFAKEKHEGQFRITNEPYIIHPVCVALILADIRADYQTICAALLHDTLEDTETSKEELIDNFGEVIYKLVDGVTKINNINVSTNSEYLTSYYKKIIVGMSEDVRVIIIKLADRLHNMRTLYVMPVEKQKSKAKETLEILAPIAHRLGMYKIKSELEDLSLRYLKPDVYFSIVEKLNNTKIEREEYVEKMMKEVSLLLKQNKIKHEIKGRAKSVYSIYKKLDKGKSFSDIYDILAIRILVDKEQECYLALGLIHSKYKPLAKRFKDYIAMPKTNLYQTLHTTVFGLDGYMFEIQIRTYAMDEIAENGIASHWAYKENKNAASEMQNITEQKLQFYKSIIELNNEKMSNEDFVNSVKDEVLNNNIYVYTPKGDVIELPKGSTPIDFAYKVHSEVGDKMIGALVNDNIVPLSYELKTSDIVKITTNKNSLGPSLEWLNIAKTTQAKSKIKSFFNKTNKDEYIEMGKISLEKEIKKRKIVLNDFYDKKNINKLLSDLKYNNLEEMYFALGNGKLSLNSIFKDDKKIEDKTIFKIFNNKSSNECDVIVGKDRNIKTHIAACCDPLPGDDIIGFITKSNGISIHRKSCPNAKSNEERIVRVSWNEKISNKYISELIVITKNNENIMNDIVSVLSNSSVVINSFNTLDRNNYLFSVYVSSLEELNNFINVLSRAKNVVSVERVIK